MWNKIDKVLFGFEGYLTGLLLLGSTLLLFVNVFLRYVFHSSTTWAEEAIRYAIIWVTFIGSAEVLMSESISLHSSCRLLDERSF